MYEKLCNCTLPEYIGLVFSKVEQLITLKNPVLYWKIIGDQPVLLKPQAFSYLGNKK